MNARQRIAGWITLPLFIVMIHTGMNLHGGNPTFFGVPEEPNPALGIFLIAGAFIVTPLVFALVRGRGAGRH